MEFEGVKGVSIWMALLLIHLSTGSLISAKQSFKKSHFPRFRSNIIYIYIYIHIYMYILVL